MSAPVNHWLEGEAEQNFGDFVSALLVERLFLPVSVKAASIRIIGSCIDDMFFGPVTGAPADFANRLVFWSCGLRTADGLSPANRARSKILAVRGKLTRSSLGIGEGVPVGDSALLLPALYQPRPNATTAGKTVAIPHFHDRRSDETLRSLGGCDVLLRSNLPNSREAVLVLIDQIASADFVLAASLHAAIVAVAYDRPFAFWDNGHVDLPFKWADFASCIEVPADLMPNVRVGRQHFTEKIAPVLRKPSMWPVLCAAPMLLRPEAVAAVLAEEVKSGRIADFEKSAGEAVALLAQGQTQVGEISGYGAGAGTDWASTGIQNMARELVSSAHALGEAHRAIESARTSAQVEAGRLGNELTKREQALAEKVEEIRRAAAAALVQESQQEAVRQQLSKLNVEVETQRQVALERERALAALRVERDAAVAQKTDQSAVLARAVGELLAVSKGLTETESRLVERSDQLKAEYERSSTDRAHRDHWLESSFHGQLKELSALTAQFAAAQAHVAAADEARVAHEAGPVEQIEAQPTAVNGLKKNAKRLAKQAFGLVSHPSLPLAVRSLPLAAATRTADAGLVLRSVLFDRNWYLNRYPDIAASGIDPALHYVLFGGKERRMPSEYFDSEWYLTMNPEVATSGINPLLHYLRVGAQEGRWPNRLFDPAWYRRAHPELGADEEPFGHLLRSESLRAVQLSEAFKVTAYLARRPDLLAEPNENPVLHALRDAALVSNSPVFDAEWYVREYPEVGVSRNAIAHFLCSAPQDHRRPSAVFDTAWYSARNADVRDSGQVPLVHYLRFGAGEGRWPNRIFDPRWYWHANDDVSRMGAEPLGHYVRVGAAQGRDPSTTFSMRLFLANRPESPKSEQHPLVQVLRDIDTVSATPLFDARWYFAQYPAVLAAKADPVVHFLSASLLEPRNPCAFFDSAFYLEKNRDVSAAKLNPLLHYLERGSTEGRWPNSQFDPLWYRANNPEVAASGLEPLTHYVQVGAALGKRTCAPESRASEAPVVVKSHRLPSYVRNRGGPRVLFIDSVYPRPDRDSGSVTARYLIDIFLGLGWQVNFFSDSEAAPNDYARALEEAGVQCLTPEVTPNLESFLASEGASFSLCMLFRVYSGGRHYEAVRKACTNAKIVFETVDLHFLREEREAKLKGDRLALNMAKGLKERELYIARQSELAIVVSDFEHKLVEQEAPGTRVMTLPLVLDCPGAKRSFSDRKGIAFVGGYLHKPNIDAVHYFLDEIFPLVKRELGEDCPFHIVGADMPEELKARADGKLVKATGYVKDLDGFLNTVRLTVAPLRYGAGVKGKVGSSLANGVPCVASPIAAEGMGLAGDAIRVAESPADFARSIIDAYADEAQWYRMSRAGHQYVSQNYSLDAARNRISDMLEMLAPSGPKPRLEA